MLTGLALEEWMRKAVCAQTDPEIFFPEKGNSNQPALRVCCSCPVMLECRLYALERPWLEGIWGGTTQRGRQEIRSQSRAFRSARGLAG